MSRYHVFQIGDVFSVLAAMVHAAADNTSKTADATHVPNYKPLPPDASSPYPSATHYISPY
jgi:hypothetical protein